LKDCVPLDGSRLSAQAVPYASEIGKRFDTELILCVYSLLRSGRCTATTSIESALATDIIAQEARVKDVIMRLMPKRYLMNWAQA